MALTMATIVARDAITGPPVIPVLPLIHRQIIAEVATKHGLIPVDLFRRSTAQVIVRARHEAWRRILSETGTNSERLAGRWGFDPVAVRRAVGRCSRRKIGIDENGGAKRQLQVVG